MRALALGALAGVLWLQTRPVLPSSAGVTALLATGVALIMAVVWLRYRIEHDPGETVAPAVIQGERLPVPALSSPASPSSMPTSAPAPAPAPASASASALRHLAASVLRHTLIVIAGATLAAGWAALLAQQRLAEALPPALEGRDLRLTGVVSGLPDLVPGGLRFRFDVESAQLDGRPVSVPRKISLGWYADDGELPVLRPGERWQLGARLKRPHGLANPQGFDAEAWWLSEGLRAIGHVRPGGAQRDADFVFSWRDAVARVGASLRDRILAALPERRYAGVIVALVIGDQRGVASGE